MTGFYWQIFLAVKVTLSLSLLAFFCGIIGGIIFATLETAPAPFKTLTNIISLVIRGLPEIVVLFICYYGLSFLLTKLMGHYVNLNAFVSGVIILGIIMSAYCGKILASSYNAIPQEELDAAKTLGLSSFTTFLHIIKPQVMRHALPALLNLWLVLLKDSSIVSLIGLHDIMDNAHIAASQTFKPFDFYFFAAVLYLALTTLSNIGNKYLTQKFALKGATC